VTISVAGDRLSLEFKSRFLMTMPGNHDIWVPGGPPGDQYDQYSWGLQQFYGQDTLASVGGAGADGDASPFDFSGGGPDEMQDWSGINNHANNSFFYHILGNLGFIGYNGGATAQVQLAYFKEACAYLGSADPAPLSVVLLGHWNDASSGCPAGADVPEVHQLLTTLPGCEALRIRYMDGHTHCNHAGGKEKPNATAGVDGFMIGGHGMSGYRGDCAEDQFGFALLDSTANSTLRILYFEERSESKDSFETILECVRQHGASGCAHMATVWL
jgi:3',5'-cyclic AMP phosphodiesterase CpdA